MDHYRPSTGPLSKQEYMETKDLHSGLFSGKLGNLVYYVRNGKQCIRRAGIPGKKPKWETEEQTERQKAVRGRFAIVQAFYTKYRQRITPGIWQIAAGLKGKTGQNYFHSMNCKCFSGEGKLVDFDHFLFSEGALLLPRHLQVVRDGIKYQVTWEEERDWTTASPSDILMIGLLYDAHPLAPCLAEDVKGIRSDLSGEFTLDTLSEGKAHIYCFFGRQDGSTFSPSCHFYL